MRPHQEAARYIGQKEILGNKGFQDPKFEAEMREEGFQIGYAWCALFAKVVYINCYPEKEKELRKLMVPGVLNTYRNLRDAAYPIAQLPQIDALAIWAQVKDGKQTGFGHCGIVSELIPDGFKSIEGNSSGEGVREGWLVTENTHKIAEKGRVNGLKLKAFVHIVKPTTLILNV